MNNEDVISAGQQADVNQKFLYDDMMLSPLLFAIRCYHTGQGDTAIIKALLSNYADINYAEEHTGFTCLIMCCHLVNEADALKVAQLLCEHTNYENQPRMVNVDAQDIGLNTPLHHAALTNKLSVCQYLMAQKVNTTLKNRDELLAIDLASADDVIAFLSQHQTKQDKKPKKSKKMIEKLSSAFRRGPKNSDTQVFDFEAKYAAHKQEREQEMKNEQVAGGRTLKVRNANDAKQGHKFSLSDFKIVDRIGGGAFGSVYLVCPKKHGKNLAQGPLLALKILEKDTVLK